jgi:hypothetical protein
MPVKRVREHRVTMRRLSWGHLRASFGKKRLGALFPSRRAGVVSRFSRSDVVVRRQRVCRAYFFERGDARGPRDELEVAQKPASAALHDVLLSLSLSLLCYADKFVFWSLFLLLARVRLGCFFLPVLCEKLTFQFLLLSNKSLYSLVSSMPLWCYCCFYGC